MLNQQTRGLLKQRLIGIDLFRGVAAYAVAIIHAGAVMIFSGFPTDNWITGFIQISRFAVPFFLAASFYLMTSKLYVRESRFSLGSNLKSRFKRLLVPYLCWSAIYLLFRTIKALSTPDGLGRLFQDPVLLIFLGGASIHLYFLPLLFSGSFLLIFAKYIARKNISLKVLIILFVSSLLIYNLLIETGNGFDLGTHCLENPSSCSIAFQEFTKFALPNGNRNSLIRLLLVEVSWLIQCLPYVFMAMILNYPSIKKNFLKFSIKHTVFFLSLVFLLSAFIVLKSFNLLHFPQALYELGVACTLLLGGIALSNILQENRLIENLGTCSFGIYLMHYLILILYAILIAKLPTEAKALSPALTLLLLATLSFVTSWLLTSLLIGRKPISKLLFGN